jgi:hypothetical protein
MNNDDTRVHIWTLKNKAQANNRFGRNNIKLFLERPRGDQKGLTPRRFTAALNNEVKVLLSIPAMLLWRGMQLTT